MSVKIFYNDIDFFSQNKLATPIVNRSISNISFGEKVGVKEDLSLSGVIHIEGDVEDCDYFSRLNNLRDSLLTFFSEDFKPIEIKEDSVSVFKRDFCKIIDVNFPESKYVKTLEYLINIECYDELIHNEFFGIINPENKTAITINEDGIYTITRQISAKGENLQDGNLGSKNGTRITSGLQNAIDFVESFSGKDNVIMPLGDPDIKIHLTSNSELIDRLSNSYSVSETYIADKNDTNENHGLLRYTIDRSKSFESVERVSISGDLTFGKDTSFEIIRNRFQSINFHEEVSNKLSLDKLIKHPLSSTISENKESKS